MFLNHMKLHNRLSILLNLGLFVFVTIIMIFLYVNISKEFSDFSEVGMRQIQDLSRSNMDKFNNAMNSTNRQFEEFQIKSSDELLELTSVPFTKSFNTGDKKAVKVWLKRQGQVSGVEEVSVISENGVVNFSSDKQFLNRKVPGEVLEKLSNNRDTFRRWADNGLETYVPKMVERKCLRCHIHNDWENRVGDTIAHFYLRVSTTALNTLKKQNEMFLSAQTEDSRGKLLELEEENKEAIRNMNRSNIIFFALSLFSVLISLGVLIHFVVRKLVARPLVKLTKMFEDIAEGEGDLTARIDIDRKDEIGRLAECFNTFIAKVRTLMKEIALNATSLNTSSSGLSNLSNEMKAGAGTVSDKSDEVASATETMSANISSMAAAMDQASTNVSMVADSTEQMTSTINDIAQQTEKTRVITKQAVSQADTASSRVSELNIAAQEIGKVTEAITEISEQTNLLALNATIEAARAGEVGKGFAVVANEIKELARQTSEATEEIKGKIGGIQNSTDGTAADIQEISKVIHEVHETVASTAEAIDEQSVTTKEIAGSVNQASQGFQEVSENLTHVSRSIEGVARDISEVDESTHEMSRNSSQVSTSANDLSRMSEKLSELVGRFKV